MAVMMGGMIIAGIMVISMLPQGVSFNDALHVAGKMGKLNVVNFDFELNDRYNIWSGLTAALFLFMSYFGTDQSQVQRYLSGRSVAESRLGLIMNGLLKVPMQFVILFIGVMVFVFYQFYEPPVFFNKSAKEQVEQSAYSEELKELETQHSVVFNEKKHALQELILAVNEDNEQKIQQSKAEVLSLEGKSNEIRTNVKEVVKKAYPEAETNDKDYVFMSFVMDHLPVGLVGLLFAVIFSAAMSSTASELNALASTTVIDIYKRSIKPSETDAHYLGSSRLFTFLWGILAVLFATYASLFENLIQAVNLLGSLFYGTILGVFVVAFYVKYIKGHAVFIAALLAEAVVVYIHYINSNGSATGILKMGYLWYNVVGCLLVVVFGLILEVLVRRSNK